MNFKKNQHYNFTHEALPTLFHHQTKGFMQFLERDGVQFLKFWWDHVGKRLDNSSLVPFKDVSYKIIDIAERNSKAYLIKLPPVQENGDVYMMACIKVPEKRMPFVNWPSTRIVALEKIDPSVYASGTRMVEVTPRARFVPIGPGPEPEEQVFYQAVLDYIWKPRKKKAA